MDYRATILHLAQLWLEGTPASRQAFDELLTVAMRQRDDWPQSPRGRSMGVVSSNMSSGVSSFR